MTRHIVHLDIPDFGASLEELRKPELKRYPLVLAELGPRAVIQGVNGAARSEGIREGMSLGYARRLCRRLRTIFPDLYFYKEQHQHILNELGHFSPLVEGSLPGRYFVDLTGTHRLWGASPDVACRMERQLVARMRLHARVGLAANKLVSQVAASCIPPDDLSCVFPGGETSFFAPLPVTFLPGVGFKTASRLADYNIQQIGQLSALSAEMLSSVFGKTGPRLLRLAMGVDSTPVVPFEKVPRLRVVRNLERDEIDRERLQAVLFQQAEEVGWLLRSHNRYPENFTLEISYADGVTVRNQRRLHPITTCVDRQLFRTILSAFNQLVRRRIAIRRMVLEFTGFSMPLRQMSLFPWEEASFQEDRALQMVLDGIRRKFGRKAISWALGSRRDT
jgi:DNA polymerase-4